MAEDEVEAVAAELARAGGLSWHAGNEQGPLKLVMSRYRDLARLAIAALERVRTAKQNIGPEPNAGEPLDTGAIVSSEGPSSDHLAVGSLVLYRPPGDRRTYPCRVETIQGGRAYLVPALPTCTGWVELDSVSSPVIQ